MKKSIVLAAIAASLFSAASFAEDVKRDTQAYIGLNWVLGGGLTPALVLGAVDSRTTTSGNTNGVGLSVHLDVLNGFRPRVVKLDYLGGKEDLQGVLGVGYNFVKGAPLLGVGVNAPFVGVGVDAYSGGSFLPNATIHSLDKFDKPASTADAGPI